MKQFACGSVIPGCQAVFLAEEEDELLREIAAHARDEHGIEEVGPDLVASVREHIANVSG
jgi:predicted small metal-binding protein